MVEKVERSLVPQKLEVNIQKNQQNGSMGNGKYQELSRQPADGGSRAWVIMLASFFCNGILFGVINSYGVLYKELYDNLQKRNVTNASGQAGKYIFFSKFQCH